MDSIKIVNFKSPEYFKAIMVRYSVLKKPYGFKFSKEIISQEENEIHLVYQNNNKIIGTLILSIISKNILQLKQFAILDEYQLKGIGSLLYAFTEQYAKVNNYNKIILNARTSALQFYIKHGFIIDGKEYISPRSLLPHYKMYKNFKTYKV